MKTKISATIITLNEERDLPRCLESLSFADEIIVVDSGSTDRTVEIAKAKGATVYLEKWHGYGPQKNLAMDYCTNDWVLNLDADEVVTPELRAEILGTIHSPTASAFGIARKTFYLNRWIRHGGWYPNYVTRLAKRSAARWTEPNVHEELVTTGELRKLQNPMLHYTFNDITDQVRTNLRYAWQGALDLKKEGKRPSYLKLCFKPVSKFFETYFFKLGFLDGLAGFIISVNAAHSMFLKYAYLFQLAQPQQIKDEKNPDLAVKHH